MDIKKLNEDLKKLINEDTLWEMSNVRKSRTGLPCNVSIQFQPDNKKKYQHNKPRVKFQNNKADRVTSLSDLIPVSIEDNPQVLIDVKYDKDIFKQVRKWIILNKDLLLEYWNQNIDDYEFIERMKSL